MSTAVSARDAGTHHEVDQNETNMHAVTRKFISGSAGGIAMTICSHPLDTIKSRVQAGEGSVRSVLRDCLKNEGWLGLTRGASLPIAIAGIFNSALFATNEAAKNFLAKDYGADTHSMGTIAAAAILAAPPTIAIITPADLIRIQAQVEHGARVSVVGIARKIVAESGVVGLQRGYGASLLKECVGSPAYFCGFFWSKRYTSELFPSSDFFASMVSGGVAGVSYWSACSPVDRVRTLVQCQKEGQRLGAVQIAKNVFAAQGLRGFYVGHLVAVGRAIPANAVCFAAISKTESFMDLKGW